MTSEPATSKDHPRPGQAPIKVVGLGLGRTGTLSMKQALADLGFGPCYHMMDVMLRGGKDIPLWQKIGAGKGTPEDLDQILQEYQSAVDYPACMYPELFLQAYPDAKFILTIRDPHKWHESAKATIWRATTSSPPTVSILYPKLGRLRAWLQHDMWGVFHRGRFLEDGPKQFEEHTERVKQLIPEDKLLVYKVGEGWEKLCGFLEVPVPDAPFPRVNDMVEYQRRLAYFNAFNYIVLAGVVGALGAFAAMGARYFGYL